MKEGTFIHISCIEYSVIGAKPADLIGLEFVAVSWWKAARTFANHGNGRSGRDTLTS